MTKILVTTDFSEKSKAAILFAIQLATQTKCTLTFINIHHILTPTAWDIVRVKEYETEQLFQQRNKLCHFVDQIYAGLKIPAMNTIYVVKMAIMPDTSIREYAEQNKYNFICISTRGAGKMESMLGTNTSNLINHSAIPVIAVPYTYKTTAINSILYAADFVDFTVEIKKVVAFAKPIKATIELVHFSSVTENTDSSKAIQAAIKKIAAYHIDFNITDRNPDNSIITDIETAVKKKNPSMMIMFTNHNRNWFEKIFLSSKSAQYSFNAKVPLLVFNKS